MNPLRRNILIFHLGALGDFILTWPLAMALARLHPQSRIIYVTHGQKGALAERALRVESTDIEAGWHHLFHDAGELPASAAKLLAGSYAIYSFISNGADAWSQQVRRFAPNAELSCIDASPPEHFSAHITDHLIEQLRGRNVVAEGMRQMVMSIRNAGLMQRQGGAEVIAVHPGSGGRGKCWPAEKYLELVRRLKDREARVRVLVGEVEVERWNTALLGDFRSAAEVVEPSTLVELMNSLSECNTYIGNDSGPTHLAANLGRETIALFGPTDPVVWGPMGPKVQIIRRTPLELLSVEDVLEVVQSRAKTNQR